MPERHPRSLSAAERRARQRRVSRIAGRLGFVGRVEYRHEYSRTGGAQYSQAAAPEHDLLIVYAEAFERDAAPDDFPLEAILAHERGHQLLTRHPRLTRRTADGISSVSHEILASILGVLISPAVEDHETLVAKAPVALLERGVQSEVATRLVKKRKGHLERLL